jgi:hypothetical protein
MDYLYTLISNLLTLIALAVKPHSAIAADVINALSKVGDIIKPFIS